MIPTNSLTFICALLWSFVANATDLTLKIYDIGQGQCAFATDRANFNTVLDCGTSQHSIGTEESKENAINDIIANSNNTLLVTISHPDIDHLSFIPDIIDKALKKRLKVILILGGPLNKYFAEHYDLIGKKLAEWIVLTRRRGTIMNDKFKLICMSHTLSEDDIITLNDEAKRIYSLPTKEFKEQINSLFNESFNNITDLGKNKARGYINNGDLKAILRAASIDPRFIPADILIKVLSANAGQSVDSSLAPAFLITLGIYSPPLAA